MADAASSSAAAPTTTTTVTDAAPTASKPKIVHVIRHGQAEHNVKERALKKRNTALTGKGWQQAQSLQSKVKTALTPPPDVVLTSPILRALQTTAGFAAQALPSTVAIRVVPDARERVSHRSHLCELPLPSAAAAPEADGDFSTYDWSLVTSALKAVGDDVEEWERSLMDVDLADDANIVARAARLSAYIERRPEAALCLVSHGAFLMRLTGDSYMDNCEMRTYELAQGVWTRRSL